MAAVSVLRPGSNCQRVARAGRAALLIDAEAYFNAFARAALRAQRSIVILGWDFHSATRLHLGRRHMDDADRSAIGNASLAADCSAIGNAPLAADRSAIGNASLAADCSAIPDVLGDFLNFLVERSSTLEVYILTWDYPLVFARGRE